MIDGYTAKAANWEGYLPGYYIEQYVKGVVMVSQFIPADSREELEEFFPGEHIEFL